MSGAVHFSADQADVLRGMEEEEIRSCMRERGHVYRTAPVSDPRRLAAENPYGLLDADWAEDDGYGITAGQLAGRRGTRTPRTSPHCRRPSVPPGRRRCWGRRRTTARSPFRTA
ncbi:hypothetical protein ABXI76_19135 [Streptomyces parvus]